MLMHPLGSPFISMVYACTVYLNVSQPSSYPWSHHKRMIQLGATAVIKLLLQSSAVEWLERRRRFVWNVPATQKQKQQKNAEILVQTPGCHGSWLRVVFWFVTEWTQVRPPSRELFMNSWHSECALISCILYSQWSKDLTPLHWIRLEIIII